MTAVALVPPTDFVRILGDNAALPLLAIHPDTGMPFDLTNQLLLFTMKRKASDPDSAAVVQKISNLPGSFTIINAVAGAFNVLLVPSDRANLIAAKAYVYDVQAQDISSSQLHTVAHGKTTFQADETLETALSIPTNTTTPLDAAAIIAAETAAAAASAAAAAASAALLQGVVDDAVATIVDSLADLVVVTDYTAAGVFSLAIPGGVKQVRITGFGAGGGGGSGATAPSSGTSRTGGGGGGGGGMGDITLNPADVASTLDITVGPGGNGAAAQTATTSPGINGGSGGQTKVMSGGKNLLLLDGGSGGGKGRVSSDSDSTSPNGKGGIGAQQNGAIGGVCSNSAGAQPAAAATMAGGGGGAGGFLPTSSIDQPGTAGGGGADNFNRLGGGALGSHVAGSNAPAVVYPFAGGGGGGGGAAAGVGKAGGNGSPGGGGGGGSAGTDVLGASGAGGNGGQGFIRVTFISAA